MRPAALLLLLLPVFRAQDGLAPGDKLCGECHTSGRIPFKVKEAVVEFEKGCTYCSELVTNKAQNYGIDFLPCPKCQAPSLQAKVKAEYDALVQKKQDWLKQRREIDAYINDPRLHLMHCATEHFEIAWSIPKVTVGRKDFDQHASMHLYANRLEEDYKTFLDTLGVQHVPDQHGIRHRIMAFESARHANKAEPKYCGTGGAPNTAGVKLIGPDSTYVFWWDKSKDKDDDELHESILHNVTHLFLGVTYNYLWLARKDGWVDEGLAHYFTDQKFKKCRTHCYQEQDLSNQWILNPWRAEVRKRVLSDNVPVFADVSVKHAESLSAAEHVFVWSWVEYLLDAFPHDKFLTLVKRLKDQVPLRDVLQSVYGVSPFQFIERWRKYVLDKYPPA